MFMHRPLAAANISDTLNHELGWAREGFPIEGQRKSRSDYPKPDIRPKRAAI